jgi:hypothetical protein
MRGKTRAKTPMTTASATPPLRIVRRCLRQSPVLVGISSATAGAESREQRERGLRGSANSGHVHVAAVKSGTYEERRPPAVPPRRDEHELRGTRVSRLARDNGGVADRVPRIRLGD